MRQGASSNLIRTDPSGPGSVTIAPQNVVAISGHSSFFGELMPR